MGRESISKLKEQSGTALVIALIMMVVLTLIGLASTFTSIIEARLSGIKRESTAAYYAADAAAQVVFNNIQNFQPQPSDVPITDPHGQLPLTFKVTPSTGCNLDRLFNCHLAWVLVTHRRLRFII